MPHLRSFNRGAACLGDAFANPFASAIGVRLGLRICSRVLRCSLSGGFFISSGKRLSNQLSLAETRSRDWTRSWPGATLEQCPFFSLYWALCAPQSGRTGIWRLTEPSAQAATRPAPPPVEATTVRVAGSRLLGLALSALGRVARGAPHRSPRDGDSLASKGLPFVLELEVPARANGSTADRIGACGTRSHHGARQSSLGRAAHPRRVAQARAPRLAADCCSSHAASPEAAFADLANIPPEPPRPPRLRRLFPRADRYLPPTLRVRCPAASPPQSRTLQRNRFPHCRLDCAANRRGVPR